MEKPITGTRKNGRTQTSIAKYSDATKTITAIDKKLSELRQVFNTQFRTSGTCNTTVNTGKVNLRSITNVGLLLAVLGEIMSREKEYNEAAKLLAMSEYPVFMWQGYELNNWAFDVRLRIAQIQQSATEKELTAIRADLQEFVTKEDKISMLQERMAKLGLG